MPKAKKSFELPENWEKTEIDEGTLYVYDDDDARTCLVRKDMTIEVRVNDLIAKYPAIEKIRNQNDFEEILKKIEKALVCAGLEEGYGCETVLFQGGSRANSKCIRCTPCQKNHQLARKRQKRKLTKEDVSGESEADRACIIKDCPGRDTGNIRLFSIPHWDEEAWCENLKLSISEDNSSVRVCSRHFEESYKNPRTLKMGARPTLNLGYTDIPFPNEKTNRFTYTLRCCIVGCDVTNPPDKLFSFPEDTERLKQWLLICVIKDDVIGLKRKYICRKHFEPSMFHKTHLKHDAVPKMDALSWLENNANKKVSHLRTTVAKRPQTSKNSEAPEVQALSEIQNALIAKAEMEEIDVVDEHKSDSLQGLQCKNVCLTCAKAFKDCETYREACLDLENQLQDLNQKTEELKNQNEILMAELESNCVVYEEVIVE